MIIPAYNAESTIERALESVLKQSYRDLEVIVADDGSTDGTVEIVDFYTKRDSRVRLVRNQHAGPGAARNAGIGTAKGEWIAFLDADDEYVPKTFETILKRMDARDLGLVIFSIECVRAYIYAWPPPFKRLKNQYFEGDGERATAFMREYLNQRQMLVYSQSNKLYRKSVIDLHQLRFPEGLYFGEDRLFNYAYLRHAGSVLTMRERFLKYHHGKPGTLSVGPSHNDIQALKDLSAAKLDLFRDYGYSESDLEDLQRHETRQFLDATVRALIRHDRDCNTAQANKSIADLLAAPHDPYFFSSDAAVSRRTRLLQLALRSRLRHGVRVLVRMLRLSEDRRVLRTRLAEIDRSKELKRLRITSASQREQQRYYFLADYEHFLDRINHEGSRNLLRDKGILLRRLSATPEHDFLGRAWLDLRRTDLAEFTSFIANTDRIVAKLFNGVASRGTNVIRTDAPEFDAEALYERLLASKQYIVETYLPQHPDLARLYPNAVASLRVHTLNLGGTVRIVLPVVLKVSSGTGITSNETFFEAIVDLASGVVVSEGMYRASLVSPPDLAFGNHPDSGVQFSGLTVPHADATVRMVLEAARRVPELPFVGWDVAFTGDGPTILEGNAASMILYSWQVLSQRFLGQRGMRADFEKILRQFSRFEKRQHRQITQSTAADGLSR